MFSTIYVNKITSKSDVFFLYLKKKPFIFSVGFTLFILFFIWSQFSAFYDSNDDVAMQMIASGKGYTAEPQFTLVYTNIIIGFLLQNLYQSFPQISFYPLYLLSAMALGLWFLIYLFIDQKEILLVFPVGMYFAFLLTIKLQFTIIAAFTGACGIAGLIYINYRETPVRHEFIKCMIAVILIWVSSLIRFQSLIMVVLIAFPSVLYLYIIRRKMLISNNWKILLIAFVGVMVLYMINYSFYASDEEWTEYKKTQKSRSQIIDFGKTEISDSALATTGLTRIEYRLICEWFSLEPICSKEQIKGLSVAQNTQLSGTLIIERMFSLIKYLKNLLFFNTNVVFMSLIMGVVLFYTKKRNLYLLNILWLIIIFLFLEIYLKISFRVVISGLIALMLLALCFVDVHSGLLKTKKTVLSVFTVLFIVLLCFMSIKISTNRYDFTNFISIEQKMSIMNIYRKPILLWGGGSSFLTQIPALEIEKNIKDFRFIPVGWLSHSPIFRNILEFNNIRKTNEFFNKGIVLIIAKEGAMSTLESYFAYKKIKADIVSELIIENDIHLYRITIN